MTDLELFQQALDDLLHVSDGLECLETIAALQDRLAQPVPEPFGWYNAEHDEIITNSWYLEQRKNNPSDDSGFSIPLYTAPQYTKLEPVGYYYRGRFSTEKNAPGIGIYGVPVYTAPPQHEQEQDDGYCQACEGNYCTAKDGCVARDNPPQREWKGLTDEEIDASLGVYDSFGGRLDARKIEAKLKEKNAI